MAKNYIPPRLNRLFVSSVQSLITSLSKRHKFRVVTVASSLCPNCKYDSTTKTSSGVYNGTGPTPFTGRVCPVCRSNGSVTVTTEHVVTANVQLGVMPDQYGTFTPSPAGKLDSSHAKVKVLAKDISLCETADHFLVDDIRYSRLTPPQGRGLLTIATGFFFLKLDA